MKRNLIIVLLALAALATRGAAQKDSFGCDVSPIVTPGREIGVHCSNVAAGETISADLVSVTPGEAGKLFHSIAVPRIASAHAIDAVRLSPLPDGSEVSALRVGAPGAYAVRIYRFGQLARLQLSSVSRFGLITVLSSTRDVYVPVDLTTYRVFRGNVDVVRTLKDGSERELRRAHDGLFDDDAEPIAQEQVVFAKGPDGSFAIASAWQDESIHTGISRVAYAQTDRPVYRPGDRVHIRAIVRDGVIGAYEIERKPVGVDVVQDEAQHPIAHRSLRPDAFGSVSTEVQLSSDATLGNYAVKVGDAEVASFSVEAYRKPEFTLDVQACEAHPIAGEIAHFKVHVAYLFGGTARDIKLHYRATEDYYIADWFGPFEYRGNRSDSRDTEGDASTDESGDATIAIPTKREGMDGNISLTVDARDESGRTVTQQAYVQVVRGTFHAIVEPSSWTGTMRKISTIRVRTLTYDGAPRANQALSVKIWKWHADRDRYDLVKMFDIATDRNGLGHFTFTPKGPGEYRYDAAGLDKRGDLVSSSSYQWVFDGRSDWAPQIATSRIVPAKTTFAPGEELRATLVLVAPARQAIVTVASDHITSHLVVPVHGRSASIVIDPPKDAEQAVLSACVPDASGVSCTQGTLYIDRPTKLLVRVTPDQEKYLPGQQAHMRLHVTDRNGNPVRAELSLGVVDEGIYAITEHGDIDPDTPFYQHVGEQTADASWWRPDGSGLALKVNAPKRSSLGGGGYLNAAYSSIASGSENGAPMVKAGVASDVYSVNSAGIAGVHVRSVFADTAYWAPSVVTDAHGDAVTSFTWPENVTTWRATAVAVTAATQFGIREADVLVHKPLVARLASPRFLRVGDSATITGIVHTESAGDRVRVQFDPGSLATPPPLATFAVDQTLRGFQTWNVYDGYVGNTKLSLRASDGVNSDGLELSLPLLGATALGHDRSAGGLIDRADVPVDLQGDELAGALHLSFAPSMMAELAQTLNVFDVYPYYCTEQTSSNGLVAAALMLAGAKQHQLHLPNDPKLVITKARAKLAELRHSDNAWGWWSGDSTSIFMTAYALYAQDAMNRATGVKNDAIVPSAARELAELLKSDSGYEATPDERALAAYALARTAPALLPANAFEALQSNPDAVTTAYLGLAAHEAHRDDVAENASQRLLGKAEANGGTLSWHDGEWTWRWWTDPIEATALAALLLHETGHEPQAQAALASVRENRRGDWWYTTLDTAIASMSIAEIEGPDATIDPDETVHVSVDGDVAATLHIASVAPDASDSTVVIPAERMRTAHHVTLERSGRGNLYWSSTFDTYLSPNAAAVASARAGIFEHLRAKAPSFTVMRTYSVNHSGPWRIGDEITCVVSLTSRDGAGYVTLEDPYPAGTEYQTAEGAGTTSWSGAQYLDDHAAFFFQSLYPGQTIRVAYRLRAITAGRFTAPGPSAFASYGPPVSAVGAGERVTILP